MTDDDSARLQICGQCDTTILTNSNRNYCDECANGNSTPIEELEALADEWEDFIGKSWDDYSSGVNDATQSCAQELREVIDDYE